MGEPSSWWHPEEIQWHPQYGQLQEAEQNQHPWPAPRLSRPRGPRQLDTGRILSPLDLVSSFHQETVHKGTIPLNALCTPTRLFEWLVMTRKQRCSRVVRQGHQRTHQRPRPCRCLPQRRHRLRRRRRPLPSRYQYEGEFLRL